MSLTKLRLPKVKLDELLARREQVLAALQQSRFACPPNLVEPEQLDNLRQTLAQYADDPKDLILLRKLAWLIAAREKELSEGPLLRFEAAAIDEWIVLECTDSVEAVWRETRPGAKLTLECLCGRPAGMVFEKRFPENWLGYLAHQVGFSRRLPYDYDLRQFIGLRFWARMVPSEREGLDFSDYALDKQCQEHNRAIIKLRMRFAEPRYGSECPFSLECDCFDCERTQGDCVAAVRRLTPAVPS